MGIRLGKKSNVTKLLLYCGVIAGPLFVITFFIAGVIRPDYNPMLYPVSSLSIGISGWLQTANFISSGVLILLFTLGLFRMRRFEVSFWGKLLIALLGAGLIGAGIFVTDPLFGYPRGMPLLISQYSLHGRLHDLFSIPVFVGLPIACFIYSRAFAKMNKNDWVSYSVITGIFILITFFLSGLGFKQTPLLVNMAGLFQRLSIIAGSTWITLFAIYLIKSV